MSCDGVAAVRANRMKNVSIPRTRPCASVTTAAPIFRAVKSAAASARSDAAGDFPSLGRENACKRRSIVTPQDYLDAVRLSAFAGWMDICLEQEQNWSRDGVPRVPAVLLLLVSCQ